MVAEGVKEAAFARAFDTDLMDRCMADLAGRRPVANPRTVAIGAGIVLGAVIDLAWKKG